MNEDKITWSWVIARILAGIFVLSLIGNVVLFCWYNEQKQINKNISVMYVEKIPFTTELRAGTTYYVSEHNIYREVDIKGLNVN
jgi:hypothetical protein